MDKNKKNMLIFGGYALILFISLEYMGRFIPIDISIGMFVEPIAILSLFISIAFFVAGICKLVVSLCGEWIKCVKKDEK